MAHLQRMCIKKYPQKIIYLNILKFLLQHTESHLSFVILCDDKTSDRLKSIQILYTTPKQQEHIYNHAKAPNPELDKVLPYFDKTLLHKTTTTNNTIKNFSLLITPMRGSEQVLGAFGSIKKKNTLNKKDLLNFDMLASTVVSVIKSSKNMSKIENMATKDALTGVFNQFYFTSHINQLWHQRANLKQPIKFGIMMIDLNGFKKINDYCGHEYGDFIIKSFAARAAGSIKSKNLLARIGGDEFVILIDHLRDYTEPGKVAERLIELASKPHEFNNKKLECSASIGIACYPRSGKNINEILRNADLALYKAKNLHNHYCYFSETLQANFVRKQNLEAALKPALNSQKFYFFFQPQVDIQTQKVTGAEALLRWEYAKKHNISVEEYVNTLELKGLSDQLNIYIAKHITKLFGQMQALANNFKLSINISPFVHNLNKNIEALIKIVQPIVKKENIHIDFEITETSFMESSTNLSTYSKLAVQLKENGIGLSLDDFGIKYSSINRLFECDFSTLKIDRSFVIKLDDPHYPSAKAIVKAIIDIAKVMNIKLIAEGADTQAQVEILSTLGCEVIQGYIYYHPLTFEELQKLI